MGAGNAIASTITDANGDYIFPNLPAGTYTLGFSNLPQGFSFGTQNVGANDNIDSDVNPISGRTDIITLAANTQITNVDAALISTPCHVRQLCLV